MRAKLTFLVLGLLSLSACQDPLIESVSYRVESNLETVLVELLFSKDVNTDLGGTFPLKTYGALEIDPTTLERPFKIGFRINTTIFNDNEYVQLNPTTVLPTGDPIPAPVGRALAEVTSPVQVSPIFQPYGYVDVVGKAWLGMAVLLKFIDERNFPSNLILIRSFFEDEQGNPKAVGAIFGPSTDAQGRLLKPGGLALFADVKSLIKSANQSRFAFSGTGLEHFGLVGKAFENSDTGTGIYKIRGRRASYYQRHPEKLEELQEKFETLIRQAR